MLDGGARSGRLKVGGSVDTYDYPVTGSKGTGTLVSRPLLLLVAGSVGLLAVSVRLVLGHAAFDIFGDEIIYTKLGQSVLSGGFPRFDGRLFFLHPPAFFYLESLWAHAIGDPPGLVGQIYLMRSLNAFLAGASGVVMVILIQRAYTLRAGTIGGLIFALDPFCVRQNDRVFLETSMILWVLLGYLILSSLVDPSCIQWRRLRAMSAGIFFGVAVLTKDEAALLTVLPLVIMALFGWGPSRSLMALSSLFPVGMYACYVLIVYINGHLGVMLQAKTSGIQRILGLVQTTGFNRTGAPSVYSRLIAESGWFGTTYLILALGAPAVVVILLYGDKLARSLGTLYVVAGITLAYGLVLGTLEEQELYILLVPSMLILPVAYRVVAHRTRRRHGRGSRVGYVPWPGTVSMSLMLALALALNVITLGGWRLAPDDGYARLLRYMASHVPEGAVVSAADGTAEWGITQYALEGSYRVGRWVSCAEVSKEKVRYVVIPWTEIDQHYSYYSVRAVRQLVADSKLLFSFEGRTYGDVVLYKLPPSASGCQS